MTPAAGDPSLAGPANPPAGRDEPPRPFSLSGGLSKGRIENLCDGVFSIVMTLLVLDIRIPDAGNTPGWELPRRLFAIWPKLVGYVLAFVILGIYWVGHHIEFHLVRRSDRAYAWLNILFMMCIAFVPFSASLLGSYPHERTAQVVWGMNLIVAGLTNFLHWWYAASGHRLIDEDTPAKLIRIAYQRIWVMPVACAGAIGLSFWNLNASLVVYLLVPLVYILPGWADRLWAARPKRKGETPRKRTS